MNIDARSEMELFDKAKKILTTDKFDRKRYLAAKALYDRAKGQERAMIGQLMESQIAAINSLEDVEWMNSLT